VIYDGFAKVYDRFIGRDHTSWADYLQWLYIAHGHGGLLRITDAACGAGGVTIPLAQMGHTLVGADASEEMLALAAQKARQAGVRIPFVCQTLQELAPHRRQDVINCTNDGVNYLSSPEDVQAFFAAAYRSLNRGGLLTFDISSRYKLEQILAGHTYGETDEQFVYLWENAYDPQSALLEMTLTFFSTENGTDYRRGNEVHIQRAHTENEITGWLKDCGFGEVFAYDAFTQLPVKPDSERIQFVAVK